MRIVNSRGIWVVLLAAGAVLVAGCSNHAQRIKELEHDLAASRKLSRGAGTKIIELGDEVTRQVARNEELVRRSDELEALWTGALTELSEFARRVHLLRKENEKLKEKLAELSAKLNVGAVDAGAVERELAEIKLRTAQLKGVCLYFPAESPEGQAARAELNQLQARQVELAAPAYGYQLPPSWSVSENAGAGAVGGAPLAEGGVRNPEPGD